MASPNLVGIGELLKSYMLEQGMLTSQDVQLSHMKENHSGGRISKEIRLEILHSEIESSKAQIQRVLNESNAQAVSRLRLHS